MFPRAGAVSDLVWAAQARRGVGGALEPDSARSSRRERPWQAPVGDRTPGWVPICLDGAGPPANSGGRKMRDGKPPGRGRTTAPPGGDRAIRAGCENDAGRTTRPSGRAGRAEPASRSQAGRRDRPGRTAFTESPAPASAVPGFNLQVWSRLNPRRLEEGRRVRARSCSSPVAQAGSDSCRARRRAGSSCSRNSGRPSPW